MASPILPSVGIFNVHTHVLCMYRWMHLAGMLRPNATVYCFISSSSELLLNILQFKNKTAISTPPALEANGIYAIAD